MAATKMFFRSGFGYAGFSDMEDFRDDLPVSRLKYNALDDFQEVFQTTSSRLGRLQPDDLLGSRLQPDDVGPNFGQYRNGPRSKACADIDRGPQIGFELEKESRRSQRSRNKKLRSRSYHGDLGVDLL
ncbi:hypothetical protein DY000_02049400 [Brassica cretica]|uniref:DFDF domain-containing protein n=1 Tax=Brassica cretica TaxID=69181 RepID=A0ABQ7F578_BRACR|nr:hypothetical protein DY000_02049400 [Brassica cretica]